MKKVGYIGKVAVYEDPNVPPGMLYMMRDEFVERSVVGNPYCVACQNRSRRQRALRWLKQQLRSIKYWWKHEVERIKAGRERTKWW